jgi:hypothetical protein
MGQRAISAHAPGKTCPSSLLLLCAFYLRAGQTAAAEG